MQEKTAGGTPAAPIKLDVSVRVIEPVKNLMGFASVKFNDCFVVENLKIVQGSKGLFLGMPSQPDGKGGYRDMAYPVTKEFREQLNTAVLQAYELSLIHILWSNTALPRMNWTQPLCLPMRIYTAAPPS